MPVTFDQLVTRACETLQSEQYEVDRDKVARVVRATLKGLDLCIANNGEVINPAPKPVINYPYDQNGVRYRGQRRRRGYRR